jgi:hypothetical protein
LTLRQTLPLASRSHVEGRPRWEDYTDACGGWMNLSNQLTARQIDAAPQALAHSARRHFAFGPGEALTAVLGSRVAAGL